MDVALIYILEDEAGSNTLRIRGELYKYLIKVRRHKEGDELSFRSRKDMKLLHTYKIDLVDSRDAELVLLTSKEEEIKSRRSLHIGWCIIDPNSIEKVLPMLCEIGVFKISFIFCQRSQKNFRLDFKRFQRVQEASMQQCGRSTYIEFDTCKSVKEFIDLYPDTMVFDFCEQTLDNYSDIETILVGCEGGFTDKEREEFASLKSFRLSSDMVLRSESAVVAIASKIVL